MNKKLLISGWFKYSHSITFVNLEQMKCLSNHGIRAYGLERSPLFPNWLDISNKYPILDDNYYSDIASSASVPSSSTKFDAYIDIAVPPAILPYSSKKRAVFMVSEYDQLSPRYISLAGGMESLRRLHDNVDFIFTPSNWSKKSLVQSGLKNNDIFVIPHGVTDYSISDNNRKLVRNSVKKLLDIPNEKIVILHVGAMTDNKGIDILIQAISLSAYADQICLVLKGNDKLFKSHNLVNTTLQACINQGLNVPEIKYLGMNLSRNTLANLFIASDLYASLFKAEGFNLPVAEAINFNIPVLTTKAPPVSEYLNNSELSYFVEARPIINHSTGYVKYFEPILDSAISQLNHFCSTYKSNYGKYHTSSLTSWNDVTSKLLQHLSLI